MQLKLEKIIPTETVLMALGSLRANKFRSALTVLGIVVGIITVVLVASILTGMRSSITSMIEEYGTNNIYAFHLSTGPRVGNRDRSEYKRKPLLPVDGDAIIAQVPSIEQLEISERAAIRRDGAICRSYQRFDI
jgi:putative ABC transport system permease protein